MFTGLVSGVATVIDAQSVAGGARVVLDAGTLTLDDIARGDSIAVDGICLTVVERAPPWLEFDVSQETLDCTVEFAVGARVNLEKSLRLNDRLGGHLVGGHVDGVGVVTRFDAAGDNRVLGVEVPGALAKYIARKGSIAINGVSLTINAVRDAQFEVNLIPHTLHATALATLAPGVRVNIEVDLFARYAERLMSWSSDHD